MSIQPMPPSARAGDSGAAALALAQDEVNKETRIHEYHAYLMASSSYQLNDFLSTDGDLLGMGGIDVLAKLDSANTVLEPSAVGVLMQCAAGEKDNDAAVGKHVVDNTEKDSMKCANDRIDANSFPSPSPPLTIRHSSTQSSIQDSSSISNCIPLILESGRPDITPNEEMVTADLTAFEEAMNDETKIEFGLHPNAIKKPSLKRKFSPSNSSEELSVGGEEKCNKPELVSDKSSSELRTSNEEPLGDHLAKKSKPAEPLECQALSNRQRKLLISKEINKKRKPEARKFGKFRKDVPPIFKSSTIFVSDLFEDCISSNGPLLRPLEEGEVATVSDVEIHGTGAPGSTKYVSLINDNCDNFIRRKVMDEGFKYLPNTQGTFVFDNSRRALVVKTGHAYQSPLKVVASDSDIHDALSKICVQRGEALRKCDSLASRDTNNLKSEDCGSGAEYRKCSDECLRLSMGQTIKANLDNSAAVCAKIDVSEVERPFIDQILQSNIVYEYLCSKIQFFRASLPRHSFIHSELLKHLKIQRDEQHDMFRHALFSGTSITVCSHDYVLGHESSNIAGGIRMVAVLGEFNHKCSGHAVFEEAKMIMEVCPGDVFFVPPAGVTITMSGLQGGESRSMIVHEMNTELFREFWRTSHTLSKETRTKLKGIVSTGVNLMPTFEELVEATESGFMKLI